MSPTPTLHGPPRAAAPTAPEDPLRLPKAPEGPRRSPKISEDLLRLPKAPEDLRFPLLSADPVPPFSVADIHPASCLIARLCG